MRRLTTGCVCAGLLVLAVPVAAVRYRIDVFAGSGAAGTPEAVGAGLPATAGSLDAPSGLARDRRGDVYIAAHGHARVRRVRTSHGVRVMTTLAGTGVRGFPGDGGPATDAELTLP